MKEIKEVIIEARGEIASGKTTLLKLIGRCLKDNGYDVSFDHRQEHMITVKKEFVRR